jgi:predicted AlkP superfamily pyrophosphatase or phosphodiesterase
METPSLSVIPETVRALLGDRGAPTQLANRLSRAPRRRVILVVLDGFGWAFVERHAEHALLRKIVRDGALVRLRSQFPSTTTANITTLHTGLPVGIHGLYEWQIYEPSLNAMIVPLKFSFAGDDARNTLTGVLSPNDLLPPDATLYDRLAEREIPSFVVQPAPLRGSAYNDAACRGARQVFYDSLPEGLERAAKLVAGPDGGYAYVYCASIDTAGHELGPSSPGFDETVSYVLDGVHRAFFDGTPAASSDTLLMLTADHGQVDVDPARVDYLEDALPFIDELLAVDSRGRVLAPAGSARDVFLHIRPGRVDEAVGELQRSLGDRARVCATSELIEGGLLGSGIGQRLTDRLGEVCVLPSRGRMSWMRRAAGVEQRFVGHHGGLDDHEVNTFVAALPLGR